MNEILSDLPGVLHHVDDILVYGKDATEHKSRRWRELNQLELYSMKVNVSFTNHVSLS